MAPLVTPFTDLEALLATLKNAATVDIGNGLSVSMGCGRQTKYAQAWKWIVDNGAHDSPHHYSDMIELDGFGFYTICRRSNWNAKDRRYETLDNGRGRFDKFTKRTADKVNAIMTEKVKDWHCFITGNTACYQPTPWR